MSETEGLPVVVVDTNALRPHLAPTNVLRVLGAEAKARRLDVVIPEIVVRELTNQRREAISEALGDLTVALGKLEAMSVLKGAQAPELDAEELAAQHGSHLRDRLDRLGVSIALLPEAASEVVLERALRRQKPFGKSDNGYRDVLIWETAIEIAQERPVMLVTKDRAAFFAPAGGTRLADELRQDLERRGIDPARIELVDDLGVVVRSHVSPQRVLRHEAATALETRELADALNAMLMDALPATLLDDQHFDIEEIDPESLLDESEELDEAQISSARITHVDAIESASVADAFPLDERRAAVTLDVIADVEVEVDVDISYRRVIEDHGQVISAESGSALVSFPDARTVSAIIDAVFEREPPQIRDVTVIDAYL